ncbi:MAG: hypothetical protein A2Y10_03080 [Planctomycetes bacterium GWF2_41_51]|nr:MAG: hypothetical protein A2Y10_03080 [Planctomycetes bacterium GWF2_41_51]HBG26060.1 hypothetical protein [Phycisphaerales bacterium]
MLLKLGDFRELAAMFLTYIIHHIIFKYIQHHRWLHPNGNDCSDCLHFYASKKEDGFDKTTLHT